MRQILERFQLDRVFSQQHIIGGTVILAVTQFGASVAGLLRDAVFNRVLTPDITDVYFSAFRPSDFLFQTCIMAAMGTVLVPVLANYKVHGNQEQMSKILSGSMLLGGVVFGVIALLAAVFMPWIAPWLVGFEGEKLQFYIQFGRLALLSNFLFVFGNTLGQYLITSQRYWMYGITPIIYTLGTIGGAIILTPIVGPYGAITGTLVGTAVYAVLRFIAAVRLGFRISPDLWHPDFPKMGMLMLPRILSLGALQLQLLVFDAIASGLPTGSVSVNVYARNFQSVLVGVTGIALAQSTYSLLGQSAAWRNSKLFKKYLRWGLLGLLLITVPGSIVLVFAGPLIAKVMGITAIAIFSRALLVYACSIPFESANHLLLRAFYATKLTLVPALATVGSTIVAITAAWFLAPRIGLFSLGLGFTAGQIVLGIVLLTALPIALRRIRKPAAVVA